MGFTELSDDPFGSSCSVYKKASRQKKEVLLTQLNLRLRNKKQNVEDEIKNEFSEKELPKKAPCSKTKYKIKEW